MRVLFYLPVCNPWWFGQIIAPMARVLSRDCDVHLMVPAPWRNTGLSADDIAALGGDAITWHLLDDPSHPVLRTDGRCYPQLLELVGEISPDLTICRSSDLEAPRAFPGVVRFLMEATVPLISAEPLTRVRFADTLFDHGFMPPLDPATRARCIDAVTPEWSAIHTEFTPRSGPALPDGRRLVLLPLEYEHPELFFRDHSPFHGNVDMIHHLAARVPDDVLIAVTHHPLTLRYMSTESVEAAVAVYPDRVTIVPETGDAGRSTAMLARRSDGMIVVDSKSIFLAAMFGTPCLRLSRFRTAAWMNAYEDADGFFGDLRDGIARAADPADARVWVGWHMTHDSFDAADPALDAGRMLSLALDAPLAKAA